MTANRKGAGYGTIVNISSVNAIIAIPALAANNASKGGDRRAYACNGAPSLVGQGIYVDGGRMTLNCTMRP